MNAREHLLADIIDLEDIQANPETVAALRELDQLLAETIEHLKTHYSCESDDSPISCSDILHRAAQAGYGEK